MVAAEEMRNSEIGAGGREEGTFNFSARAKPTKRHKFIFGKGTKNLLPQAVRQHCALCGAHGKLKKTFETIKKALAQNLPESISRRYHIFTIRNLRDVLCSIIEDRGQTNKRISTMSGIEEASEIVEELLNEFIRKIN